MRITVSVAAILCLLCAPALSGETRILSTTSGGKTSISTTTVEWIEEGSSFRVEEASDEESATTFLAEDGTVRSVAVRAGGDEALMASDGKSVEVSGTWKGKPIRERYELKGRGFYGRGFGFAARAFARGGWKPLQFPMINLAKPSRTTVLELKREGTADFKGRAAIEAKLAPTGARAMFWSARILLDEEGRILRYSGNQGPGTPDFVTELVETRD